MLAFINYHFDITGQYSPIIILQVKFSVKQHKEPAENIMSHSVLLVSDSPDPPCFGSIYRRQPLFKCFLWPPCLAKSIWAHLERHTHPAAQGIPDLRSNCLVPHLIHCLPHSHLGSHLDHPSHRSSWANVRCGKCIRVHCRHHFRLDDGRFSIFGEHSLLEFVL